MERTNPAELSIFVTAGTEVSDSLSADVPTCRLPPTEPAARLAFPWEGGHTRVRPDEMSGAAGAVRWDSGIAVVNNEIATAATAKVTAQTGPFQ